MRHLTMPRLSRRTAAAFMATGVMAASVLGVGPAHAVGPSITVAAGASAQTYVVTPTDPIELPLEGTFTLRNTLTAGDNDPRFFVSLVNGTGQAALGGESCTNESSCSLLDVKAGTAALTLTLNAFGTFKVMRSFNGAAAQQIGTVRFAGNTFTIGFERPSGRTCPELTRIVAAGAKVRLPSIDESADCIGEDRVLDEWELGTTTYAPGSVFVPTGDTTFRALTSRERAIVIDGSRTTISDRPGVKITGQTFGFKPGATLTIFFRLAGETGYREATAQPEVDRDGTFEWQRKTGKKIYVYVTSRNGSVRSNRVIIPAR